MEDVKALQENLRKKTNEHMTAKKRIHALSIEFERVSLNQKEEIEILTNVSSPFLKLMHVQSMQ